MNDPLIIENARILDPASARDFHGALLIDSGKIFDVVEGAAPGAPANVSRIDAGGLVLAPGLIDMRVFTGEPGFEYRETLKSASEAAAAGGVTSFVMMPDANRSSTMRRWSISFCAAPATPPSSTCCPRRPSPKGCAAKR